VNVASDSRQKILGNEDMSFTQILGAIALTGRNENKWNRGDGGPIKYPERMRFST
jgi:hypothetical protein